MSAPIWLLGFRGSGKTTLGRALARDLNLDFLDLDEEFERRHGSILTYVDRHGLDSFRAEEARILNEEAASAAPARIVATGGGFVDWEESRKILGSAAGDRIWLDPPAEALWQRLQGYPERLKIGGLGNLSALRALLEKRRPFYAEIATFRLESQDISECLALLKSQVTRP